MLERHTGHPKDIFCGPAMMSSSSFMICRTETESIGAKKEENIINTLLSNIFRTPIVLFFDLRYECICSGRLHKHNNHVVFLNCDSAFKYKS